MRMSVRYQVLAIVTLILFGSMSAYLWLASRLVRDDKIAYVYEVNASLARAKSEELQGHLSSLAARLDYFAAAGACSRSVKAAEALLDTDADLLAVEVWQQAGPAWARTCRIVDDARLEMHDLTRDELAPLSPGEDLIAEVEVSGGIVVRNTSLPPDRALLTLAMQGIDGRFLVAHLHPGRILPLFAESRSYRAWVVDRAGNVLLHPDPGPVVRRENLGEVPIVRDAFHGAVERGAREFESEGTAWIGAFSRVPAGNLVVVTTVPRGVALSAMQDLTRRSVLFALVVVLVALLSAVFFSRRITRPLSELESAASALAQGRLGHEVRVHSADEIGRLAAAFNRMSRDLQGRERNLEEARAQLAQADRMALVGTLAAGIAHEINNPLTWINANLKFAASAIDAKARARSPRLREAGTALAEAITGAERVRAIVADLKLFSRKSEELRDPVDVRRPLETALKMVGPDLRRKARVVQELADGVPPVAADEARLGQIFLNLVVNALQALPDEPERNEIRIRVQGDATNVVVEVSDNGCGIAPELLGRIFDPFFTTKPAGVGTGLGLSICHGLVTAMGGTIRCRSTPGAGTTFAVSLPAAEVQTAPAPGAAPVAAPAPATGTLLVVDDQPEVIAAVRRMLPELRVEGAADFAEAMTRLTGSSWDYVLVDLLLPGRSGIELFEHVRTTMNGVEARMVFTTGAVASEKISAFLDSVPNERVDKPFDARTLREAFARTREMLEERETFALADGLRSNVR